MKRIANEERSFGEMVESLKADCPGIGSAEFLELAKPVVARIEEEYGPTAAEDLTVLKQVYSELGGEERFTEPAEVQAINKLFARPKSVFF